MKKTRTNKFKFFLFNIILMCLFLFNLSCGLDTFEVIEAPYQITKKPEHNDVEEIQSYENKEFEFFTNESGNYSEITFLGTEVYYKIYNNFQTMYNERSGLITASDSTSTSVSATQSLISKYKKLRVSNEQKTDLLIPKSPSNSPIKVNIRLTDYDANYCAQIQVNGNPINSDYEHSRPLRNMDSESTFNFDRDGDNNKIPADSDSDFSSGSFSKPNIYYVCLFAVGTGVDMYYSPQYSKILYLGTVTIDSNAVSGN